MRVGATGGGSNGAADWYDGCLPNKSDQWQAADRNRAAKYVIPNVAGGNTRNPVAAVQDQ